MYKKSKLIVPLLTWLVISLSLLLSIFIKLNRPVELKIASRYLLAGFIGFLFSFLLRVFNLYKGSILFLILSILSGVYFYISMPLNSEEFGQLGALLSWLILMVASIVITLTYELIRYIKMRNT